jgi:hypothetical protein
MTGHDIYLLSLPVIAAAAVALTGAGLAASLKRKPRRNSHSDEVSSHSNEVSTTTTVVLKNGTYILKLTRGTIQMVKPGTFASQPSFEENAFFKVE